MKIADSLLLTTNRYVPIIIMDEIKIKLLADHPEWVPIIAKWHWDEWGHLDTDGSLLKWIASLAGRNNHDQIPMSFVAVENGKPIGSVTIEEHDMETRKDLTPWLAGVYIKPECRSRGVASQLIHSALETANRLEINNLYLYTHSASGLYAKLGWIELEKCQYQGREVIIMVNRIGT